MILLPWEQSRDMGFIVYARYVYQASEHKRIAAKIYEMAVNAKYVYTLFSSVTIKLQSENLIECSIEEAKAYVDNKLIELGHKPLKDHMLVLK